MTPAESEAKITLPAHLAYCRHRQELVSLVGKLDGDGWVVYGYHGCLVCRGTEVARLTTRTHSALIGDQEFPISWAV